MNALVVDQVSLRVDGHVLFAPLSFSIAPGTVTSIVGPSGSGKSSLLGFLCGIAPSAIEGSGSLHIGDEDLATLAPEQRRLGLLFQDPLLFPHLSVAANLLFGLPAGPVRAQRRQRVAQALASVGLDDYGERDPDTLSGGQKARVALLRVLLAEPRALLLDEPFGALDEDNRRRVRELVFAQARERQLPTLLVTHDDEDVTAAGGPVVVLERA
jgi:putative thiamine transport system ATP-binding protein